MIYSCSSHDAKGEQCQENARSLIWTIAEVQVGAYGNKMRL